MSTKTYSILPPELQESIPQIVQRIADWVQETEGTDMTGADRFILADKLIRYDRTVNRLDFDGLAKARTFDLVHDVAGILRADKDPLFLPRFAR